jgi:hypothetical protein
MSGTRPPSPVIAPVSGSAEQRLQQISDAITRNTTAISVLQDHVNTLGARRNASVAAAPADAPGTASATNVMMGYGAAVAAGFVLTLSGATTRAMLMASGEIANDSNNGHSWCSLWMGTGTPPANGAAVPAGAIQVGGEVHFDASSNQTSIPFTIDGLATGLTADDWWVDMAARGNPGTTTLTQVQAMAVGLVDAVTF